MIVNLSDVVLLSPTLGALFLRSLSLTCHPASVRLHQLRTAHPRDAHRRLPLCLAVALKAITAVLCPLIIRASNPAADWIDSHLPGSVQDAFRNTALGCVDSANPLNPRGLEEARPTECEFLGNRPFRNICIQSLKITDL